MSAAARARATWRRLKFGLPTVLGLRRGGWFIPHRYAADLDPPGSIAPYPAIERLFEAATPGFEAMLDLVDGHAAELETLRPLFEQAWFPGLDAAVAWTLMRERRPGRVIEIGSGHSTRLLANALRGAAEIVAIDPEPRADIAGLPGVRVEATTLQRAPAGLFETLGPGDVLFIDSSHILMPGSDVDFLLNRVVPTLPPRTLLHIHDIFLPFDYPAAWAWRNYNEQQGVVPLMTAGAFVPVFSSVWAERRLAARVARSVVRRLPFPADALATSLWLERR
ncbi:MAG: class I SAM-dependent methyltransferase [Alphaproteobacteria bacterium]|nr:class I SAM-dependent methyltransferase [Alphaproteobacteria bacterium]